MEERKKHEIHWVNREDANFPERLKKLTRHAEKAVLYWKPAGSGKAFGSSCGGKNEQPLRKMPGI